MASASKTTSTARTSKRQAKKSRVAVRTRTVTADPEDVDELEGCACDIAADPTLDEELPAAFGAVETAPKRSSRSKASRSTAAKKTSSRRSSGTRSRSTGKRSTKKRTTAKRSAKKSSAKKKSA